MNELGYMEREIRKMQESREIGPYTKYRVTLEMDITTPLLNPRAWLWHTILDLGADESVEVINVEILDAEDEGDI